MGKLQARAVRKRGDWRRDAFRTRARAIRLLGVPSCTLLTLLAAAGSAWSKDELPSVGGVAALDQAYSTNVYQAVAARRQSGYFVNISGQIDYLPKRWALPRVLSFFVNSRIYPDHSDLDFVEFGPRCNYRLANFELFFDYTFNPHKFAFPEDDGNAFVPFYYEDNDIETGVRRKLGSRNQLRLQLLYEGRWTSYDKRHEERDAFYSALAGEARYRFPIGITPLVGFEYGYRGARRDNFDREQMDGRTGMDIELPFATRLHFRYWSSWREYTVDDPKKYGRRNSNYGREDRIQEYAAWFEVPLPLVDGWRAALRYRYAQGDFDSPNRRLPNGSLGAQESFDVNEIGVTLVCQF